MRFLRALIIKISPLIPDKEFGVESMNEELAQQSVMNLAGLVILTAIPIAAFALWCDYFERFFQAKLDEREEVNRADELYRIRTAGFFINLVEILIFFGSTPIRREHPAIAYPLFLT